MKMLSKNIRVSTLLRAFIWLMFEGSIDVSFAAWFPTILCNSVTVELKINVCKLWFVVQGSCIRHILKSFRSIDIEAIVLMNKKVCCALKFWNRISPNVWHSEILNLRSVLFRINNGNKTPDDSDAGVSLESWCPDQSITKIYHLNGFKALPVLAIFKQSSSRGLERTSRLRM